MAAGGRVAGGAGLGIVCNWVLHSSRGRGKTGGQAGRYLISPRREEVRISRLLGYRARTWLGSGSYPNEYVLSEYLTLLLLEDVTFDTAAWGANSGLATPYDVKKTMAVVTAECLHATPLHSRCMQPTFTSLHPLNHTCDQKAVYTKN